MKVEGVQQGSMLSTLLNKQPSPQELKSLKENGYKDQSKESQVNSVNVSLNITVPRQTLDTLERIGSLTDLLNSTAKRVRETDSSLKISSDIIAQMKDNLARIIKNYPPYPIDSSERRDILRSYSALRKQIDSMTIPPPPTPVYDKIDHLWNNLFNGNSGKITTPELTETSSDLAVKEALSSVTSTGELILQSRSALGASV